MTFRQNISRFVTGEIDMRSLPDIALQALQQNLDTPSLRILAGLSDSEDGYIIDNSFKDTLKELSIDLPDKRQAAIEVGLAIAEEIFEGKQNVLKVFKISNGMQLTLIHFMTRQKIIATTASVLRKFTGCLTL